MPSSQIRLYNSLTKKIEPFAPLNKGQVAFYSCGPTVYDYAHLGNMFTYIRTDLLRRHLEFIGYEVKQIINITDFGHLVGDEGLNVSGEDKLLKGARREGKTPKQIAEFYTQAFLDDRHQLNILDPMKYPKASEHIPEMIALIQTLINKGFAYESNGNVFFSTKKFPNYGKLSGNRLESLKTGARLEPHPDKKDEFDFLIWQKVPQDYPLGWKSPWSFGFPGWHIECSAMAMKYLGETIDIHSGGIDNKFPHHECEIAQSEAATGKPFARFWFHPQHLMVGGERMAKSRGNFYRLQDIIDKGYGPLALRLLVFQTHYRSIANFTWDGMTAAQAGLTRIRELVSKCSHQNTTSPNLEIIESFRAKLSNDLDSAGALAVAYDYIRGQNKKLSESAYATLLVLDRVLGLKLDQPVAQKSNAQIETLIVERDRARAQKNFARADEIRQQLAVMGIEVRDENGKTTWKSR